MTDMIEKQTERCWFCSLIHKSRVCPDYLKKLYDEVSNWEEFANILDSDITKL